MSQKWYQFFGREMPLHFGVLTGMSLISAFNRSLGKQLRKPKAKIRFAFSQRNKINACDILYRVAKGNVFATLIASSPNN